MFYLYHALFGALNDCQLDNGLASGSGSTDTFAKIKNGYQSKGTASGHIYVLHCRIKL